MRALERELEEVELERLEIQLRNDIVNEIMALRLNSKNTQALTEDEIAFQIEQYRALTNKFENELAEEKKALDRCYAIDRFIY
jgi:hypothetical protein